MPRKIIDSSSRKTNLREINPDAGRTPAGQKCPSCKGDMTHGPVPCPDNDPKCEVVHYGLRCSSCGKLWH